MIYFWYVTLTGENKLVVSEDRVLREGRGNRRLEKSSYGGASWSFEWYNQEGWFGGGTCHTFGEEKRCMRGFGGETWGKEPTWKT